MPTPGVPHYGGIVSPNKTLYIRETDMPVWVHAEQIAKSVGQSVSQLATEGLRSLLGQLPDGGGELEQITVETGDGYDLTEGFTGRWLVAPDSDETRTGEENWDAGTYWGIALTKKGQIAVYTAHCNQRFAGALQVYPSLEVAEADVPEDILAKAADALGIKRVLWRDI
jgi:hypothetical protein